jgi:hypothetical protein
VGARPEYDPEEAFSGGAAVVVATVSDDGRPALTRGWGPRYDREHHTLTLSITAPAGSPTLENLESTGAIAVTASQPLTYHTLQVKGTVDHVDVPSEQDRAEALAHLGRFVAEVAQLGLTAAPVDNLFRGDLRTVTFAVGEMYDQTPGRGAGSAVS